MVTGENSQMVPLEDVCVVDGRKVLCIVRDMVDTQCHAIKHTMNLPASLTIGQMIGEVAKQFGYIAGTITVHYEKNDDKSKEVELERYEQQVLGELCSVEEKRHNFSVCELEGQLPQKVPVTVPTTAEESTESGTSSSQSGVAGFLFSSDEIKTTSSYTSPTYSSSDFTYASALTKSDTGYVGLVNQAMTCYLNSLIQTLYMTPEFRNAIYRWECPAREDGVRRIPYQLQRLFLQLQTSKKRATETTDLTRSFGWDSSEVWQQHDVQELCRVMFDALETTWRNTDQEKLINQLYQGKMKDYVKCLECSYESARVDSYLDVPLVIRPFGSNDVHGSVSEALRAFVQPEILEGRDQYFCDKCNKKCNAHKGLKFISFPYLLTMQLKRFDFDYNTMHRIKLNDRMTFPEILNLNHLVEDPSSLSSSQDPSEVTKVTSSGPPNGQISDDEGVDEGIEMETNSASGTSCNSDASLCSSEALVNDKNTKESEVKGPYVYELFSIMIHSGSAAGGHYYAYIKCLSDGQWYSFNDQHVSKITYDDIRKTYGGSTSSRGYYSSAYASSTNAYMLMYRQIDKERNADFTLAGDLPMHVKEVLRRLNDKEEADRKQKELDKSTCKIKLFCNHPSQRRKMDMKMEIHKDKTLKDATEMAYKMFDLEDVVTFDCCRIVKYDEYQDSLECSFEDQDDTPMDNLLGGVKQSYSFDLLLETKKPHQTFQQYRPGGVTVKVFVADMDRDVILDPPVSVRAYLTQTVGEFKAMVSQILDVPDHNMRCVLERFHNDLKILFNPNKTLKSEGFFKTNKVYIESNGNGEDGTLAFQSSKFYRLLDRHQNTIRIHVNLPSQYDISEFQKFAALRENSPTQTGGDSAVESGVNSAENSVDNGQEECNGRHDQMDVDEGISDRSDSDMDTRMRTLTLQTRLSRSDPYIYKSCQQADDNSSLQGPSTSCSQSTSTSAEFSLSTNHNSNCDGNLESTDDISPPGNDGGGDFVPEMRKSLEGLNLSEVRDRPKSNGSTCVAVEETCRPETCDDRAEECGDFTEGSGDLSPSSKVKDLEFRKDAVSSVENWERECTDAGDEYRKSNDNLPPGIVKWDSEAFVEEKKYFHADVSEESGLKSLTVFVDKRITLGDFKKELEPYVGVGADNFKVFRVYPNNQEFESIRLTETLSFLEDGKINIKLGRALKNGEYRVKVYQLLVNNPEPSKFLLDTIFAKGMSVLQCKKQILPELKIQHKLEMSLNRCRLRKKTWKNPGTIYVDAQVYEDEIPIYPNWEVFLEVLTEPEEMLSTAQLAVYVRRWSPSKYELGPFQEIILNAQTMDELKNKISEISEIPVEDIEIAKGRGTFPFEVSLLEIHTDLEWNPSVTTLGMWPLYICDDGCLVYFRDKKEELLELSEDKKKELQSKENARLSKISQRVSYSPRKEKALKIYTEEHHPASSASNKESQDLYD